MSTPQKRKIVFAVGGTGGHLFPAQALARELKDKLSSVHVLFMGSGLSTSRYFFAKEFPSIDIESSTVFGKKFIHLFGISRRLVRGIWKSIGHLRKEKPDLVVGFGSFHAFPVLVGALVNHIPIVLFESNVIPGRVIRYFSRFARCTAVQFSKAGEKLKGEVIQTRMPLWDRDRLNESTREEAARYFGLRAEMTTILIFGGSQGARSINRLFCQAMQQWPQRPSFQIIHLTGDVASCHEALLCYRRLGIPAQVKVFEDRMPLAWRIADLAICRSGAATIAELLAYRVPAILIPYPHATDDHQMHNARIFADEVQGAKLISENQLNAEILREKLITLMKNQEVMLKKMRDNIMDFEEHIPHNSLFEILKGILEV
jgi:UDP-N-acetylglucosamine--N-acetylmuramyl-(pentapeptide) pyrophosphoryl-undecaprenol N-acetylglucosamine transferase